MDRAFFITFAAVRRQLAAMPSDLYLLRVIHYRTRKAYPIEPLWSPLQLAHSGMLRYLRRRNREGFDVYIRPYAGSQNAGYILLDLDDTAPDTLARMCAQGHEPCVVLQTSPGHLQTWVRVSEAPLEPVLASQVGKELARAYSGDLASTDWCHLGRLAGFTNQKPARRQANGYGPWVRLLQAQRRLATHGPALIQAAQQRGLPAVLPPPPWASTTNPAMPSPEGVLPPAAATAIYHRFLHRLRIPQRFPQPDWSIADLWVAQALLRCRTPVAQIQAILRLGSPGFPRRHGDPEDYLARTLRRATRDLQQAPFSARRAPAGFRPPPTATGA